MSAVIVRGLKRRFGATRVLSGLDLDVEPGELVAITGPNGSGKTTLLRILAGLLRPSEGVAHVLGGSIEDAGVRRRIGLLGHVAALYPRMTALENLRFWARLYDDAAAGEYGRELLDRVGLDSHDRRPVATYSQGMRQRAAVARALCTRPDLVLADEPLAGLDAAGADAVAALLGDGHTLIVATHDPGRMGSTRRLELHGGRLHPA